MSQQKFPDHLQDKIFEVRYRSDNSISKIVSYFPFSKLEKHEIISTLNDPTFDRFYSIFSDIVSHKEWERTKDQIKQKFKDELFDIDKT
ncbi:MAG: hypothetical protein ACE5RS_07795 [Nitrosopumilus sp.]|jgi:hypothetical protein|nr:hypothetical protein [Nitrosopumilus sp.]